MSSLNPKHVIKYKGKGNSYDRNFTKTKAFQEDLDMYCLFAWYNVEKYYGEIHKIYLT